MTGSTSESARGPEFKVAGVCLAVASGLFIGVSFVLKKKGLLAATAKSGKEAGEGYEYLKNAWWWTGMTLMIIGEICNFAAYMFVEAILVTPLGALSVVISAILSSIFLKERLSFIGKIGCALCIIGSCVIVVNAPEQQTAQTIQDMQYYVISPGFLSYTGIVIVLCACIAIFAAPRWGSTNMFVYITVCSLIGGLSVVATQGIGAAIITQIEGKPQFNQWFTYFLLAFVVVTLLTEIIYLNKALNIFNAALVTPTYYTTFTSATLVTSAILFRGFKGTPSAIATVVLGFLVICCGVVLLQLSKSSKFVSDTEVFRGDLDQVRTIAEQSEPESEPRADTIRGAASVIRRFSTARRTAEADEARRIHMELEKERAVTPNLNPDWDGIRRRATISFQDAPSGRRSTFSSHPPLMAPIPDVEAAPVVDTGNRRRSMSVDEAMRQQVYPDAVPDMAEPGFLDRMRNLFKRSSQQSLGSTPNELTAITPHRDIQDHARRPYTATAGSGPILRDYAPYSGGSGDERSKSDVHVRIASPESMVRSVHFNTDGASSVPAGRKRGLSSESAKSDYSPLPRIDSPPLGDETSHLSPTLRPGTGQSARRQFSFQNILGRHGRKSEEEHDEYHAPPHKHWGHGHRRINSKGKTEEEMLGLVKGDTTTSDESEGEIVEKQSSGGSDGSWVLESEKGLEDDGGGRRRA